MKKLLLALTLVLCLTASMVALTSCGGSDECEHTWAPVATVDEEATCTSDGAKSIKCTVCGEKKADSVTTIPSPGHTYDSGVATPPTCTEDGSVTKTCTICGYVNTSTVAAPGHAWAAEATVDVPATCTGDGQKSVKCTACNATKPDSVEVIPTGGHAWSAEPIVIIPATCLTDGSKAIKCSVCNETKPDSTEAIPAPGHTWADEATVDTEATCLTDGQKSVKCVVCETTNPDSIEAIPAAGQHVWADDTDVTLPTLFADGIKTGTCSVCAEALSETLPKTEPVVEVFTPGGQNVTTVDKYNIVTDVLKGDHFYPTEENPNGKSLYLEFSFLWNETLGNIDNGGDYYVQLGALANGSGSERIAPYFIIFKSGADMWCQFPGGFETDNNTTNVYGPAVLPDLEADAYTYIGEYGWHRVGIEYTQTAEIVNGAVEYTLYTTLYIDGVKALSYKLLHKDNLAAHNNKNRGTNNLLYTATIVNGELEYDDIADSRYIYTYRFGNNKKTIGDENAYFVVGDVSVTCGTGFVMDVDPLTTPTEGTFSPADGVELNGDVYYAPGCEHENADINVTTVPTIFGEGEQIVTCRDCGEVFIETVPATKAQMNPITTIQANSYYIYESANVGQVLGDKKLYGEDGVDLYVEFSILLNSTMDMVDASNFTLPGIYMTESLAGSMGGDGFYFLYLIKYGMPKGSFEIWNSRCNKVENGYLYGPKCEGDGVHDVFVGNFDGWHRIGVQMHFEAYIEDFEPVYINTATLYIDGVKVHSYKMRTDDDLPDKSILTAIRAILDENGENIVDYENEGSRWVCVYRYSPCLKYAYDGETAYFPIADVFVTAGDGFVLDVTPVTNPEAEDFTQDGVTLSGKTYFEIKTAE